MIHKPIRIGVAGWSLPRAAAHLFPADGSHLERYAGRLGVVEINSSFYRPHRPQTYARWAASTPEGFRFAVKAPRSITHERRLLEADELLNRFLGEIAHLGDKLGPVLVQLPPSLAFDAGAASRFFDSLRGRFDGLAACEPRHRSWFTPEADDLLAARRIARVAADPPPAPGADRPAGWTCLVYQRLHGSPEIYRSDYGAAAREGIAGALQGFARSAETWCVFDNTAEGCAWLNALDVKARALTP